jgi:hypothetical protein
MCEAINLCERESGAALSQVRWLFFLLKVRS